VASKGAAVLDCPVASRCGGCPEYLRTVGEQRLVKFQGLLDGLERRGVRHTGHCPWLVGRTVGYRNRIRLALVEGVPGYFNPAKAPDCRVLEPRLIGALAEFAAWAEQHPDALRPYRVAEVRTPDADGNAAVYLRHTERNGQDLDTPDWRRVPSLSRAILAFEGGPLRTQRFWITEEVFARVPIGGFMQVNASANRRMVERVVDWARSLGATSALDLFAGSGNFALPLAHAGLDVTAVEQDAGACLALERAAAEQHLPVRQVSPGDALGHARALTSTSAGFDLVVVDPPRGGLRRDVDAIRRLSRKAVVLVSCDAARFCDDAEALQGAGMTLAESVCVDMFPHTRHMEVLGLFRPTAGVA
jgi:23S rRNA (uracil1939-C5)-methyltransferase